MQVVETSVAQQIMVKPRQRRVIIERLNEGKPIISPNDRWWEDGVTFNSAALYLSRSPENDKIITVLVPARTPVTSGTGRLSAWR